MRATPCLSNQGLLDIIVLLVLGSAEVWSTDDSRYIGGRKVEGEQSLHGCFDGVRKAYLVSGGDEMEACC